MRQLRRATLALPVVLIVAGLAIPVVVDGGSSRPPSPPVEPTYAGRTADEWHALAGDALERGQHAMALKYMKTAERVSPGSQYGTELAGIRRARRRAELVDRNVVRMLGGDLAGVEIDERGRVLSAHRRTVALPGESLWSLASALIAASKGVMSSELDGREEVYAGWDRLTDLNGMRELEVGEIVMLPVPDSELVAMSLANADDLERIRLANVALDSGRIERAKELRDEMETEFAVGSGAVEALNDRIRAATIDELVASAKEIADRAANVPRTTDHGELVSSLRLARQKLEMAGRLGGVPPAEEIARVDSLLSEAERFALADDGRIVATKPEGVAYAEFAQRTIEWFLGRTLEDSGAEYPHSERKSADEVSWSRYMLAASAISESRGVDFGELLLDPGERHVVLPNPAEYFEQ